MAEIFARNAQVGGYYLSRYGKELKVLRQEGLKTAVLNLHTDNEVLVPGSYLLIPLIKDEDAASLPKPVRTPKPVVAVSKEVPKGQGAVDDISDPERFRASILDYVVQKPRSFSELFNLFGTRLPESAHKILNVRLRMALSHLVRTRGIVEEDATFQIAPLEKAEDSES